MFAKHRAVRACLTLFSACLAFACHIPTSPGQTQTSGQDIISGQAIIYDDQLPKVLETASPGMILDAGQKHANDLPARQHRVEISSPGDLGQDDTEYVLVSDISASSTAFTISGSRITFNLNGHTIIYGIEGTSAADETPSYGIFQNQYGSSGIIIANGTVIQRPSASGSGSPNGLGKNPLRITSGVERVTGLYLEYHTANTSGIASVYIPAEIDHNTLVDKGSVVSNRHQGVPAINTGSASGIRIHHNKILDCRQSGINLPTGGHAWNNEIHINSYCTNSYGIFIYQISDFQVHHNVIHGHGEHPIGFGPFSAGSHDGELYFNYVETENTRGGPEYGSGGSASLRMTWGDEETRNINIYANYFKTKGGNAHADLPEHPWYGAGSWGRTLWIGGVARGNRVNIYGNHIEAESARQDAYVAAVAVVCNGYNDKLLLQENTIISSQYAIVLADSYGNSGESPSFARNTFRKQGDMTGFKLVSNRYPNASLDVGAHLFDNDFSGLELSPQTIDLLFTGSGKAELVFYRATANGVAVDFYISDNPNLPGTVSTFGQGGYKIIP